MNRLRRIGILDMVEYKRDPECVGRSALPEPTKSTVNIGIGLGSLIQYYGTIGGEQ